MLMYQSLIYLLISAIMLLKDFAYLTDY